MKIFQLLVIFIFCGNLTCFAQEKKNIDPDFDMKMAIYKEHRKEVLGFNKKNFDDLFFEFFDKQSEDKPTLTKEQYYTYTIKISIYSERLGLLYKDQKETAKKSKADWFAKNYQDYQDGRPKKEPQKP